MPRSSAARQEKFKPGLFERLKQSNEDKKRRGHLKVAPAPRTPPPVRIEGGFFGSTVTINTNIISTASTIFTNTATIEPEWDQWNGMLMNQQTRYHIASTANAWSQWTQQTTGNSVVWKIWTDSGTTAGSTVDCWDTWQTPRVRHVDCYGRWVDVQQETARVRIIETEQQKKLRAEQDARWTAEVKERQRKMDEEQKRVAQANATAMELLNSCLNREQRECLKAHSYFFVKAKSGRLYRIDHGSHGNVKVVDPMTKKMVESLCIQPDGLPLGDSMLAQKLFIEAAEDVFRQHANITLADGKVLRGIGALLTGDEVLAPVIPIRRAA